MNTHELDNALIAVGQVQRDHERAHRAVRIADARMGLERARRQRVYITRTWDGDNTAEADEQREFARHDVRMAEIALKRAQEDR
jgi:hypothetical protein